MSKVYIFGPIHLFGDDYLPVYKNLRSLCQKYFDEVICTYPDFWDSKESPRDFYDRTYKTITKCDLFIGEISAPSIGVGMELQMAQEHGIPCIVLCKKGIEPSTMAIGIPCTKKAIYYEALDDLSRQIETAITEIKSKRKI